MKKAEEYEQIKLMHYCTLLERTNKILMHFAIPNGGSRNVLEAANMKRAGVRAGVSDYCVVLTDKVLFIEMKRKPRVLKDGKLSFTGITISDNQRNFISAINMSKVCEGFVCYGFDEAKEKIDDFIKV